MNALDSALQAWRALLGPDAVTVTPAALDAANRATHAECSKIVAVLSPWSPAQIADCLLIATQFQVPVHPVSRGCNWGYGSRLPPRGEAVLLSLARLDRVRHHDDDLATVRVEPGVTFLALQRHLAAAGSRLLAPTTGSGPHTSVLGNVLERGIGKGLYEDMGAHVCGFELTLPTGETVHTGPAPGAATAGLAPISSGPGLRELFIQSNLGVVTAMDLWLHEAPNRQQLVWARLPDAPALAACIDALRPLLQRADPWLRAELVSDHRARTQGVRAWDDAPPGWIAAVTLWGEDDADLAPRRRRAEAVFAACPTLQTGALPPTATPRLDDDWASGEGLRGAYAGKPAGMPTDPDPDRDRCGVLWVAPMLPLRGHAVAEAVAAIAAILAQHGFGPAISLRNCTGRTIQAVVGLFYDRDEAGADARATRCTEAVHTWLRANALAPYRLGILEPAEHWADDPGRYTLLRGIKRLVDPAGILSPGRYIP